MKKLFLATVVVVLLGVVCGLVVTRKRTQAVTPRLTLPDGSSVRIMAVTYGTNHVVGSKLALVTERLPDWLRDLVAPALGKNAAPVQRIATPTPELLIWLQRETNHVSATVAPGYSEVFLGDRSNFVSGADAYLGSYLPIPAIEALHFSAFPRRNQEISLNVFYHDSLGNVRNCGQLYFRNPVQTNYPVWQSETLPATKREREIEVTLSGVETGHDDSSIFRGGRDGTELTYGTNRLDGRNYTAVNLKLRALSNTNEIWQVAGVEVSDATGNSVHNSSMTWSGNDASCAFMPGLWPDEPAWKLKLEVKRTEGFRPEEILAFKNVPVGKLNQTNTIGWTTNAGGITVTLQSLIRRAPQTNNMWSSTQLSEVKFTHSTLPPGTQLDLLRAEWNSGKTNRSESWSSGGNEREYYFREIPQDAQTGDFIFVVQQSRTVEFIVKPKVAGF